MTSDCGTECAGVVSCGVGTMETKTSEVGVVDFVLTACVGSTRNRGMGDSLYRIHIVGL